MTETPDWKAAWHPLTDSENSSSIVLAVDFDTTGRAEARFADMVRNIDAEIAMWETIPPSASQAGTGADYIEHWARTVEPRRLQVRAVTGFCAGAVYAAALAERIGAFQETEPLLILIDPELSTAQTLLWQYHKVMGFMAGLLPAAEIAEARAAGQRLHDEHPDDVGALKDALVALARAAGEPGLERAGLDRTRRDELFEVFTSFLGYLAAAADIDPLERWRSAVAFSSTSPLSGLNAMRAAGWGDRIEVRREITVDVEHGAMLAHKDLADGFAELVA
jgi:hypothetical protein